MLSVTVSASFQKPRVADFVNKVEVGMLCCVCSAANRKWYRAVVKEVISPKKVGISLSLSPLSLLLLPLPISPWIARCVHSLSYHHLFLICCLSVCRSEWSSLTTVVVKSLKEQNSERSWTTIFLVCHSRYTCIAWSRFTVNLRNYMYSVMTTCIQLVHRLWSAHCMDYHPQM